MNANLPPPLPQAPKIAALTGLLTGIVGLLLTFWVAAVRTGSANPDAYQNYFKLGVFFLLLIAAITSFYGFLQCRRFGYTSFSTCAGTALGVVAVSGMVMTMSEAFHRQSQMMASRKSAIEVEKSFKKYQQDLRKGYERNGTITGDEARLDRVSAETRKAGEQLGGTEGKIMQASAAYMEKLQAAISRYSNLSKDFAQAKVLDASLLTSRDVIRQKRELVENLLQENQKLTEFIRNAATHFETELKKQGLSSSVIASSMTKFRAESIERQKIVLEIRATDDRIGKATLGILDILNTHFGEWRTEPGTGRILIEDEAVINLFNSFYAEIRNAYQAQVEAQGRLLKVGG